MSQVRWWRIKFENFEQSIRNGNAETAEIANGVRAQVSDGILHALIGHQDRNKIIGLEIQAKTTNEMLQKIMAAFNAGDKWNS